MLLPTDLLGQWRLARRVIDRRTGESWRVAGRTTLAGEGADRVRWTEAGTMVWSGGLLPVTRTLLVDRGTDDTWTVRFADGRPFHAWRPNELVTHDCAPDRYSGILTGTATAWSVVWEATGPTKDYRTESTNTAGSVST